MPFSYYQRLTPRQQRTYRASDAVAAVPIPAAAELRPLAAALEASLREDRRLEVERASRALAGELCRQLCVPPVRVRVLAARPSSSYGELHGLYDPEIPPPLVTLWMRTAAKRRVVAYKSFLRTLVHELLHHLDYELFRFDESFHTEGFFQRESSIARQLLGTEQSPAGPERPSGR